MWGVSRETPVISALNMSGVPPALPLLKAREAREAGPAQVSGRCTLPRCGCQHGGLASYAGNRPRGVTGSPEGRHGAVGPCVDRAVRGSVECFVPKRGSHFPNPPSMGL